MPNEAVTKKVLASTGTIGWGMILLGNLMLMYFIKTIGLQSNMVLADAIWCLVLDVGAIILFVTCDERFKKKVTV